MSLFINCFCCSSINDVDNNDLITPNHIQKRKPKIPQDRADLTPIWKKQEEHKQAVSHPTNVTKKLAGRKKKINPSADVAQKLLNNDSLKPLTPPAVRNQAPSWALLLLKHLLGFLIYCQDHLNLDGSQKE